MSNEGGKVQTHRDLEIWRRAIDLVGMVYDLTGDFPTDEKFGLISQMRRATVSIPANIAEGFGRKSRKELVHFLYIASGSISELNTHLEIGKRLGSPVTDEVENSLKAVKKMLFGLILSVKKPRK